MEDGDGDVTESLFLGGGEEWGVKLGSGGMGCDGEDIRKRLNLVWLRLEDFWGQGDVKVDGWFFGD